MSKMLFNSIQWAHPSTTVVAGPSNSGKTTLISKILQHKNQLFTSTQKLKTVLFYNQYQEIYRNWSDDGFIDYCQDGIPSLTDFEAIAKFYSNSEGAVIIFDDLGAQVLNNLDFFEHIFVVLSHHLKLSIFLVVHNLFEKGLRKISLNTNRFIITANYRDQSQIGYLSRQAFPGSKNFLTSVYNYILSSIPYGYIVLDFSQNRNKYLRISTRWFSKDNIMVFTELSEKCPPADGLKTFRCYHLIADNIYNLLSSGHYQKSCNNITNNNSLLVPGFEKDLNRNDSNNRIETVKQRDDNTPTSSNVNTRLKILDPLDITTQTDPPLIKDITTQTDTPLIKDITTQTKNPPVIKDMSTQTRDSPFIDTSTQTTNTPIIKDTSTQTSKFPKPKQIKPKTTPKIKPKTFPKIKTIEIIGEYTPENINIIKKDRGIFTNNTKDNNIDSIQQPSQINSKAMIKKIIYKRRII